MKKLLIAGLAVFAIAACSNDRGPQGDRPQPPQQQQQQHQHQNSDVDTALKACHESVGTSTTKSKKATKNAQPDHSAIDACMKQKGFEKPANHPNGAPNGQAPAAK